MKRTPKPVTAEENSNAKTYWRSAEQLSNSPEFRRWVESEYPEGAAELELMKDSLSRRKFLTIMAASFALAGLSACRRPVEKIVPYVKQPEEIVPGIANYYATTMPFGLSAYGVLVKSNEGRPTKIEGNEKHPSSTGGTNTFVQASILGLYDPDRSKAVYKNGSESSFGEFVTFWRKQHLDFKANGGEGLAILTESFASPTLSRLMNEFMATYPNAKVAVYEAVSDENIFNGIQLATGELLQPIYDFSKAKVILSLDADCFLRESENVMNARGFADGRRVESEKDQMNRLYVVESTFSVTGGMADHRLKLQSCLIGAFTAALALELNAQGVDVPAANSLGNYATHPFDKKWISAVAKDLIQNRGASLVVAGRHQSAEVHALVTAINSALKNVGTTVSYRPIKDAAVPSRKSLVALVEDINAGRISTLLILGGNPVYDAPADLNFESALKKVKTTIHWGLYRDETAQLTTWHIPATHYLEQWGDAISANGTISPIQPLIAPLYKGKSNIELLNVINTGLEESGYTLVRQTWKQRIGELGFEENWKKALHEGVLTIANDTKPITLNSDALSQAIQRNPFSTKAPDVSSLEFVFLPSESTFDGRFANNAWLQELPGAVTKLAWDNAALMSLKTAKELGLKGESVYAPEGERSHLNDMEREVVKLIVQGRALEMPVWIVPGQADYSITLPLGYGRKAAGNVGNNIGFNCYALRTLNGMDIQNGTAERTGKNYILATTQNQGSLDGRESIVIEGTLDQYLKQPDFVKEKLIKYEEVKLFERPYKHDEGHQWGMTIDLNACIGCNACAIACQSENNIPVVGKEQTRRGRQMHWIRIDRYFAGDFETPEMVYQPVACQQCENAPCEQVCPVAATAHTEDGINAMVYNRCVGTRYCANNCPYKVRRFNYFNYVTDNPVWDGGVPETVKMAMNPDVTVRFRGVMEKCNYCYQRIAGARINAKNQGREIADGEIKTACEQSCPTQAIVFGDINDPNSKVSQMKRQKRNYDLLAELNVKPRTSYLAKLRNPNPELEKNAIG
ncbi:MAG: TAT-variant-translocated molybdopterin oxidoreductase [Chloroherpetonaceae bacterium]